MALTRGEGEGEGEGEGVGGCQGLAAPLGVQGHSSVRTNKRLPELRNHQLVTETWAIPTGAGATCSHRKSHTKNGGECLEIEISKVHLPDTSIRQKGICGKLCWNPGQVTLSTN